MQTTLSQSNMTGKNQVTSDYIWLRDCRQISFLILGKFELINELLFSMKLSENLSCFTLEAKFDYYGNS